MHTYDSTKLDSRLDLQFPVQFSAFARTSILFLNGFIYRTVDLMSCIMKQWLQAISGPEFGHM